MYNSRKLLYKSIEASYRVIPIYFIIPETLVLFIPSSNILLIPGTSSIEHLRENVAGAGLQFPDDAIKELDDIAS